MGREYLPWSSRNVLAQNQDYCRGAKIPFCGMYLSKVTGGSSFEPYVASLQSDSRVSEKDRRLMVKQAVVRATCNQGNYSVRDHAKNVVCGKYQFVIVRQRPGLE